MGSDRLTDLVLGLHRIAENAHIRGDDIEYSHREEVNEYIAYLDQLLGLTDKLRNSLLADRKRFMPVERVAQRPQDNTMPRIVAQGPKEAAG